MTNRGGAASTTRDQAIAKVERDELVLSSGFLLARVGAQARQRWSHMLARHGLAPHDFSVLMMLATYRGRSQQEISRLVGVDPRNAVPLFDRLADRHLVAREPDPTDRRRRLMTLTDTGRRMLDDLRQAAQELEDEMLSVLSLTEREQLQDALAKLYASAIG